MSEKCIEKWQAMYDKLKFAKENPNSKERISYSRLSGWIASQRIKYKEGKLTSTEIKLLEEIGIDLVSKPKEKEIEWDNAIAYVIDYFMEHGNIAIPCTYILENGFKLGRWLGSQRIKNNEGKLSLEKFNTLDNMYMIWNARDNNIELKSFCEKYHIYYSINKERMSKLPISRLEFMINFLVDRGISYIDDNGYLLDIIFIPYVENMLDIEPEDNYSYMLVR